MTNNTTLGRIFYNPMLLEKYFLEVCKLMSYGNSNVEDQHKSLTESPKLIRGSHCWSPNGWFCLHKPHIRPWFPLQPLNGNKKQSKIKKIFRRQKERRIFSLLPVLTSTLSEGSVDPNFLPLCLSLSERGKLGKLYFCWREIQTLTPVTSYFNTW